MDLTDEDFGYFVTTFGPKETGVPATIHIISGVTHHRKIKPYMLIARSEDRIYDYPDNIKIELKRRYDPIDDKLLTKAHQFISINYNLMIDHWKVLNDSIDLDRNLKSV